MVSEFIEKVIVVAIGLCAAGATANSITSVCSIVDIPLGSNVLSRIESRNRSTADLVVLGNIRAMVIGNVRDQSFYFSDSLRNALNIETGLWEGSGAEFESGFAEIATSGRFTDFKVSAVSNASASASERWDVSMSLKHLGVMTTNSFSLVLSHSNSQWWVEDLILEGLSIKADP